MRAGQWRVSTAIDGTREGTRPTYAEELAELLRVLVVAGVPLGVVVAGLGGRLAMLVLRLTSPDVVLGQETDDGFVIGEITMAGTYNLLVLGAAVGFIGAAAYVAVAPWLPSGVLRARLFLLLPSALGAVRSLCPRDSGGRNEATTRQNHRETTRLSHCLTPNSEVTRAIRSTVAAQTTEDP